MSSVSNQAGSRSRSPPRAGDRTPASASPASSEDEPLGNFSLVSPPRGAAASAPSRSVPHSSTARSSTSHVTETRTASSGAASQLATQSRHRHRDRSKVDAGKQPEQLPGRPLETAPAVKPRASSRPVKVQSQHTQSRETLAETSALAQVEDDPAAGEGNQEELPVADIFPVSPTREPAAADARDVRRASPESQRPLSDAEVPKYEACENSEGAAGREPCEAAEPRDAGLCESVADVVLDTSLGELVLDTSLSGRLSTPDRSHSEDDFKPLVNTEAWEPPVLPRAMPAPIAEALVKSVSESPAPPKAAPEAPGPAALVAVLPEAMSTAVPAMPSREPPGDSSASSSVAFGGRAPSVAAAAPAKVSPFDVGKQQPALSPFDVGKSAYELQPAPAPVHESTHRPPVGEAIAEQFDVDVVCIDDEEDPDSGNDGPDKVQYDPYLEADTDALHESLRKEHLRQKLEAKQRELQALRGKLLLRSHMPSTPASELASALSPVTPGTAAARVLPPAVATSANEMARKQVERSSLELAAKLHAERLEEKRRQLAELMERRRALLDKIPAAGSGESAKLASNAAMQAPSQTTAVQRQRQVQSSDVPLRPPATISALAPRGTAAQHAATTTMTANKSSTSSMKAAPKTSAHRLPEDADDVVVICEPESVAMPAARSSSASISKSTSAGVSPPEARTMHAQKRGASLQGGDDIILIGGFD